MGTRCRPRTSSLSARLVVAGLAPLVGCSAPGGSDLLAGSRCASEVSAVLDEWGIHPGFLPAPPAPDRVHRLRIPTGELGVWVVLDVDTRGAPSATLVRPEGAESISFDQDCAPSRHGPAGQASVPNPGESSRPAVSAKAAASARAAFTDEDLRAVVAHGAPATVVYVWSPHMPLSVDGYREILAASETLRLQLVPVLFAGSEASFAASEAARGGIPAEGLREIASIELAFRDAQVHAPTILVFDRERVSPALPGYRNAAGYRRFIEDFLGATAVR